MRAVVVIVLMVAGRAASADDRGEARRHFFEAKKQYELGHFAEAAKEYEAGYNLFQRPGFLWDIAQSYRKLGDNEKALHFYKMYVLNAEPGTKTAVNVPEAQDQIRILGPLVAAQQKARSAPPDGVVSHSDAEKEAPPAEGTRARAFPARTSSNAKSVTEPPTVSVPLVVAPVAVPSNDQPTRPAAIAALSLLGGALGCAAVSTGLVVHAHLLDQTPPSSVTNLQALVEQADRERIAGWSLYAVSGAALVGASVAFGFWLHRRSHGAAVAVRLLPTGAGVGGASIGGTW